MFRFIGPSSGQIPKHSTGTFITVVHVAGLLILITNICCVTDWINYCIMTEKVKQSLYRHYYRNGGFQEVKAPRFQDNRDMKVVRLSALRTDSLYPPRNIPGTHLRYRLSQPQRHSAAGRITSIQNSNGTIGNRSRDLQACSAVRQPTAPLPLMTVSDCFKVTAVV